MKSTDDKMQIVDYQLTKAKLLQSMKKNSRAIETFKAIVKACPGESAKEACSKSFLSLAEIYFKEKKWNAAKKYYRDFEQKYPGDKQIPWSMYQIANIDNRTGKYKQALDGYRMVMEKYPDSYWSTQAKWKRDDAIWQHEYKGVLD